jgi:hypothetical protein
MNLIRNGGFERGNMDYWVSVGDGSAAVTDVLPMHGTYCLAISTNAGETHTLYSQDYIPVIFGQIVVMNWHVKSPVDVMVEAQFYEYDGDLNLIKSSQRSGGHPLAAYSQFQAMLSPEPNTEYVRVGIYIRNAEGPDNVFVDSFYASTLSGDDPLTYRVEIASLVGKTSGYNTGENPFDMLGFEQYYADIDCTVLTGTAPTLDVTVHETDVYGNEKLLGTFAQLAAAGHERITLDAPIGDGMYVKYVEGGTWTNATFDVTVTGVRS